MQKKCKKNNTLGGCLLLGVCSAGCLLQGGVCDRGDSVCLGGSAPVGVCVCSRGCVCSQGVERGCKKNAKKMQKNTKKRKKKEKKCPKNFGGGVFLLWCVCSNDIYNLDPVLSSCWPSSPGDFTSKAKLLPSTI